MGLREVERPVRWHANKKKKKKKVRHCSAGGCSIIFYSKFKIRIIVFLQKSFPINEIRRTNIFSLWRGHFCESVTFPKLKRNHSLVVMGDNTCSKDQGFESWRSILDGHLSHWLVLKIELVLNKDQKLTEKRPGRAHLKKKPCAAYLPIRTTFSLHETVDTLANLPNLLIVIH